MATTVAGARSTLLHGMQPRVELALAFSPLCWGHSLALQRSAWPTVRLLLLRPKVSIAQKSDPIRTILLGLEDAREILGAAFGREINGDGHFAINIANPGRKHV